MAADDDEFMPRAHELVLEYERRPIARVRAVCSCGRWSKTWVRESRARVLAIAFGQHLRGAP